MSKNFYEILGITDDEKKLSDDKFDEILKRKYRKLASQNHPDKFANKSEAERNAAEDRMKDINEAYETLSDKKKRAAYDNPNPFGNGMNFDGFDGFSGFGGSMLSSFFNQSSRAAVKGGNVRITLNVQIDDILNRTLKKVKYKRSEGCGGQCMHCGGTGREIKYQANAMFSSTCRYCGGTGHEQKTVEHECSFTLDGVDDRFDVDFNPSTNTVSFLTVIKGEGNTVSEDKSMNGDLHVIVRFQLPNGFTMESPTDIARTIEIPVLKAIIGGEVEVGTITGTKLKTKIPHGVPDGARLNFNGQGLTSRGKRGNMIGIIKLRMPTSITDEDKTILSQLSEKPNFK